MGNDIHVMASGAIARVASQPAKKSRVGFFLESLAETNNLQRQVRLSLGVSDLIAPNALQTLFDLTSEHELQQTLSEEEKQNCN